MKMYVLYYPSGYEGVEIVGVVDNEESARAWVKSDPYCNKYEEFYLNNVEF